MLERNWEEVAGKDREEMGEGRSGRIQYAMYSCVKLKIKF